MAACSFLAGIFRAATCGQRTADGLLANPLRFTHNPPVAEGVSRLFGRSRFNAFRGEFMVAVRLRIFHLGLMLATALVVSMLATAGQAYTPEQQQACSGDAFRLCGPEIPDVDRVTACMVRNKAQLSPDCRAFFRPEPESAATRETTRPLSIRPVTERKRVKPRKSKKPKTTS
jgi:hypothetical protein